MSQKTTGIKAAAPPKAAPFLSHENYLLRQLMKLLADAVWMDTGGSARSFYRRICRLAATAVESDGGSLFLAESDGQALIEVAIYDPGETRMPGRRLARGESMAGASLAASTCLRHSPAAPHPSFLSFNDEINDLLAVPVALPEHPPDAVLCLHNSHRRGGFSDDDQELMELFAEPLAYALRVARETDNILAVNRRLLEENDRTAQLHALALLVADGAAAEEISEAIVRDLGRLFGLDRAGLFVLSGDSAVCLASRGLPDHFGLEMRIPMDRDLSMAPLTECVSHVMKSGRACVREGGSGSMHREGLAAVRSAVGLPIQGDRGLKGVVFLARGWDEIGPYVIDELGPVQRYLDSAAAELARCRTYSTS